MAGNPHWQRVAAILDAAIDLPETDRAAFVQQACAGDYDLLAEIVALLVAHANAGGFLAGSALGLESGTRSVAAPGVSAAGAAQRFAPGQIVGRYRIDRLLGRGGMGEVYSADEIEHGRRVALKVLSGNLPSLEDRDRFLREGRLASAITHPNSVYVFGSDIIDGHPVIVMELLGGTLKDRVLAAGRLPVTQAVDAILQVIAGLEAAHAGGIVHRDVKPGNCFVDHDGTVKIGDFGLSVTTSAQLTQFVTTGAIRATPQFAPPEQLKGAVPDIRADIYSVGATLFTLLTGRPPFDDAELLTLITRIVTDPPPSPRTLVPTVPRGLAAAVVRCLVKDPDERYQTYAALRTALLPFRSGATQAAPPGGRIVAMVVDQVLFAMLTAIINVLLLMTRKPPFFTPSWPLLLFAVFWIAYFLYFLATEGVGSASPGKRLMGLEVVAADGGRPRLVQVAIRTAIFVAAAVLPFLVPLGFWVRLPEPEGLPALDERVALLAGISYAVSIAGRFVPVALFITARRANGWTGLHELLSGTRVCRVDVGARQAPGAPVPAGVAGRSAGASEPSGRRGGFVVMAAHGQADGATLWQAFDPVLEREVWVRDAVPGTGVAPAGRRELARPGRLRWLAGHSGTPAWDAFEAPRGAPFTVVASRPLPWSVVREWLADLARELAACEASHEAATFTLDHVWITAGGRAMLLDFPPPGAHPANGATAVNPQLCAQRLLLDVAWTSLHGTAVHADRSERMGSPLPPSGTALLDALKATEPQRARDLLDLASRALTSAPAVPRWSRALPGVLLLVTLALVGIFSSAVSRATGTPLAIGVGSSDDVPLYNTLVTLDALDRGGVMPTEPRRHALEVYAARRYEGLERRAASFTGALTPYRALALDIGRRHPVSPAGELESAIATIDRDELDALNATPVVSAPVAVLMLPVLETPLIAAAGALAAVLAFAMRGGLLLTLLRLVVVDASGRRVTRLRSALRALVTWAPTFALLPIRDEVLRAMAAGDLDGWLMVALLLAIAGLTMMGWALVVPSRGLQEQLCRTWIVPA